MYERILISTDGSEVAQKGVEHGLALARAIGAGATIVMVVESLLPYVGADGGLSASAYLEYANAQKTMAEKVLDEARLAADGKGVEVDTACLENILPAEAIIETARARNCGLIVMSSHGRRGLRRLILGSVTSEVLANSPIPVLVVR